MHLSWLGLSAFKIETKDAVLVTDPYAPSVAARPLRAKADIVLVSQPASAEHGHVAGLSGAPFVIDAPGEYEVKGVYVRGIPVGTQPPDSGKRPSRGQAGGGPRRRQPAQAEPTVPATATCFTVDLEGMRLAHLGCLQSVPANEVLEQLGDVDVLFLPVGGGLALDPDAAMRVVNAVEPRMVVPMHFQTEGFAPAGKLLPATAFLREIGASKVEAVERAILKAKDLPAEETSVLLFRV